MAIHLLKRSDVEKLARTRPANGKKVLTHDGEGLFFRVATSKAKDPDKKAALICSWVFRYRDVAGNTREMGLGAYPLVDLTRAREKAQEARSQKDRMEDPIDARDSARAALALQRAKKKTFRECWKEFWKGYEPTLKSRVHRKQWVSTMDAYVLPILGDLQACAVDTQLVLKVLQQPKEKAGKPSTLWAATPETARRVRSRIETVLEWAKLHGHREGENPARWEGHLEHALGRRKKGKRKHHAALPWADLPAFMVRLRKDPDLSAAALEFTILTAARTNETIGARWEHFNLDKALWVVPAAAMKADKDHRVPLSRPVIAVLERMKKFTGGEGYVFPGRKQGDPLSNMAMLKKLKSMGDAELTVHGFRSSFRDWVRDTRKHDEDLAEIALSHTEQDETKAAYARSDMLDQRRPLMNAWAVYCGKGEAAKVVSIGRA